MKKPCRKVRAYQFQVEDGSQILSEGELEYQITVVPDALPVVQWVAEESEQYALASKHVDLTWLTEDDYGVKSQELSLEKGSEVLVKLKLDEGSANEIGFESLRFKGWR